MEKQIEIRQEQAESGGSAFCDGCGKQIKAVPMLKFFWRKSGENAWNDGYLDNELHSHDRSLCIGKVMRKMFS